jgi:hypothetical protein
MTVLAVLAGLLLIVIILQDVFETAVLPRRVNRTLRLARFFYRATWFFWSRVGRRLRSDNRRESFLGFFGPLSLILLLAVWAAALVVGFALLQWGLGTQLVASEPETGFGSFLYFSGTNFFTLGLGDVATRSPLGRALTVVEVATGFGLLALVIGYLPILYQAFSRREVSISLLDARAGSPPTAVALVVRLCRSGDTTGLREFLRDWERWSAELLESHLSYPVLAYYRSQHDRQSWLASLTAVLDVCALLSIGIEGLPAQQPGLTFAIARHAAVDLSQVFIGPRLAKPPDRLPPAEFHRLREALTRVGFPFAEGATAEAALRAQRDLYEPYVAALASRFLMPLPGWLPAEGTLDDWQTTAS